MLGLANMDKSHWGCDDACRMGLTLTNQITEFHQGRRRITKGKEGIRMFLNSQTDACLSTGDTLLFSHLSNTRIRQIALSLNTQTLEGTLSDATCNHRYIADNGLQRTIFYLIIKFLYSTFVCMKDILHLEIGCGVDGMQQGPLMIKGPVFPLEFAGDGTEGFNHDGLAQLFTFHFSLFTSIVASRGNDVTISDIRLRITYQDNSKHIDILRVEGPKGCDLDLLVIAPSLTHIAYGRISRAHLKEKLLQTIELPIASMRLGIIDGCYEITNSSSLDATLDDLPGRHEITQGDDTEVVTNGGTQ